jgi:hypothetical protein
VCVRALECTDQGKTASPWGRCELAHCLDAESMISFSTIPAFSSHSLSELGQDLQVVLLINCSALRSTISLILSTISLVFYVEGHPGRSSPSTSSRPSMNRLCHSETCVCDITFHRTLPLTFRNILSSFFFPFSCTRNFRLLCCSILILVTNLAEQHNMVTLKQSSEANQLTKRDESSLV